MNIKKFCKNLKICFKGPSYWTQLGKDLTLVYELRYIKNVLERYREIETDECRLININEAIIWSNQIIERYSHDS